MHIIINDRQRQTAVFALIPWFRMSHVINAKIIVPVTEGIIRDGHISPPEASAIRPTPLMKQYEIAIPIVRESQSVYSFALGHKN